MFFPRGSSSAPRVVSFCSQQSLYICRQPLVPRISPAGSLRRTSDWLQTQIPSPFLRKTGSDARLQRCSPPYRAVSRPCQVANSHTYTHKHKHTEDPPSGGVPSRQSLRYPVSRGLSCDQRCLGKTTPNKEPVSGVTRGRKYIIYDAWFRVNRVRQTAKI